MMRHGFLLAAALWPLLAAQPGKEFRWHSHLNTGQVIEIKNVNGDIRAEAAVGREAEVTAVKTARRSDPNSVDIQVVERPDGVTICAVYPGESGRPNECKPDNAGRMNTRNNDVRVNFTVRVPAGVRLIGRTVNGEVNAASLTASVQAFTVNGKIQVSTSGSATAKTVNGGIEAKLGKIDSPVQFETVNGPITLTLPSGAGARVSASTVSGDISTDFPLTVAGKYGPKRLSGAIGGGGPNISVKTVNGSISLRKG